MEKEIKIEEIDMGYKSIEWKDNKLILLDQTKLPESEIYIPQENIEEVWDSIKRLVVRGAPAIGVAVAYGLLYSIKGIKEEMCGEEIYSIIEKGGEYLKSARPTAVNLSWAINRMLDTAKSLLRDKEVGNHEGGTQNIQNTQIIPTQSIFTHMLSEAKKIHEEDMRICLKIGENSKQLISPGSGILIHCNPGGLATSILGTATSPMYLAHWDHIPFKVYVDETRPLLQGSRLTAWELSNAGINVTLITDNMSAHMMSTGLITLVLVGCDRVAANGDAANKIGTLGIAIIAKYYNIPFYIACPTTTLDLSCPSGKDILIEERHSMEVTHFKGVNVAPHGVNVRNPAFDVTPAHLITAIITERGIVYPPFMDNLGKVLE